MGDLEHWNKAARCYAERVDAEATVHNVLDEALWRSLGDVAGLRILDAGCGHGWLCEVLLERGADVVGLDGASALVEMARARVPDATILEHDLRQPLLDLGDPFDVVVAHMVVMDVEPLEPLFASVARVLRPGGKFVFTLTHPAIYSYELGTDEQGDYRKLRRYLEHYTLWVETFGGHTHYHRPLSYYVNLAGACGLAVVRFEEPDWSRGFPVFCLLEARRVDLEEGGQP